MDSDLEQRLNRGLKVEQRGLEEGGWRIGLGDKLCVSSPHPWLTLYRWPRGLGRSSRRFGSPTWTPKPSKPTHTFPPETFHNGIWKSHLEDLPPLFGAPPPPGRPGQPRWLAPQGQGAGQWVV